MDIIEQWKKMIDEIVKHERTTRNIRKPGGVGKLNFCTFNKNSNGLTSRSFEIPASAYYHPLGAS